MKKLLILACLIGLLTSCATPPEAKNDDGKKARKAEVNQYQSSDESLQDKNFSNYEEIHLVLENTTAEDLKELRVTKDMKEWLRRNAYDTTGKKKKKTVIIGYLQSKMRGFYAERKYTYFVYNKDFTQPLGFFHENGKTYKYVRTFDGEVDERYLGTTVPQNSIRQILRVRGGVVIKPLRSFKKRFGK